MAAAAAAAGVGSFYWLRSGSAGDELAIAKDKLKTAAGQGQPTKAFRGGDQGFIPLTLDQVDVINHNTKYFRFKLPEDENVSGLNVACKHPLPRCCSHELTPQSCAYHKVPAS